MNSTANIIPIIEQAKTDIAEKISHTSQSPFYQNGLEAFTNALYAAKYLIISDGKTYTQIPEIMGTLIDQDFEVFRNLAYKQWTAECGVPQNETTTTETPSILDVVFANIYKYERTIQHGAEDFKKSFILREWDNFKLIPREDQDEILRAVMKL